jgi:hypothetical protein
MYHQLQHIEILCSAHNAFMRFAWISEQTAIISLYSINLSVFITEAENVYCAVRTRSLTFKNRASYIEDGQTATLQMLHFIYFFNNFNSEYFKHAAHTPFFSSKCRLFYNATFLVHVLFAFYI